MLAYLIAGYAAFFLLLSGYVARLALMGRRLARERERLAATEETGDGTA